MRTDTMSPTRRHTRISTSSSLANCNLTPRLSPLPRNPSHIFKQLLPGQRRILRIYFFEGPFHFAQVGLALRLKALFLSLIHI